MSDLTVHKLLMAYVQTITTDLPIAYPGRSYTPSGEYIRVTHLPNTPSRVALDGDFPLDRIGILQLDIFAGLDRYEVEYIATAQAIADQFPHDARTTESGVTVEFVKTWIGGGRSDGIYWQTPIFVEYRA
jgi:hypothetical protein